MKLNHTPAMDHVFNPFYAVTTFLLLVGGAGMMGWDGSEADEHSEIQVFDSQSRTCCKPVASFPAQFVLYPLST